jgi:pimeloyl-ACP methyl ester carboxylesterase
MTAVPEAVSFALTTPDGVRITMDEYHRDSGRPVIVVCHGFFQNRRTPRFLSIARAMLECGFNVVTFDFRGHGHSRGWYTFGRREPADLRTVLERVRPHYPAVGLLTFSMGASIAIRLLGGHSGHDRRWADALIAVSAVSDLNLVTPWRVWWPGALRSGWRQLGTRRRFRGVELHYGKPRALDAIERVSPVPVLFVHSEHDWLIPLEHGQQLHERARNPKHLVMLPGRGHAEELIEERREQLISLSREWFDRWLTSPGAGSGSSGRSSA